MRGSTKLLLAFTIFGVFTNIGSLLYAGQWDRAVGPARSVETAAREVRRRIDRLCPNQFLSSQPAQLERAAQLMIEKLRSNFSHPSDIAFLLQDMNSLHERVQSIGQQVARRHNDHLLRTQLDHLARRITELKLAVRRSIDASGGNCGIRDHQSNYRGGFSDDRHDWDDRFYGNGAYQDSLHRNRFSDDRYFPQDDWNQHFNSNTLPNHYYNGFNNPISRPGDVNIYRDRNGAVQGSIQTQNGRYSITIGGRRF
jgi:hypothetical protein